MPDRATVKRITSINIKQGLLCLVFTVRECSHGMYKDTKLRIQRMILRINPENFEYHWEYYVLFLVDSQFSVSAHLLLV